MISIISSLGKNNELGKNNSLIWRIPRDMKFFKETTMGHTVLMGKNTYESLPGSLPGRKIIVLSFTKIDADVDTMYSVNEVLNMYENSKEELFICGGASIYHEFIEYADVMYLTEIDAEDKEADTFFPKFDKNKWEAEVINTDIYNGINYRIVKYVRKDFI